MNTFSILPPDHVCTDREEKELIDAGLISNYIAPRTIVRDDGRLMTIYPFVGTVDDARPIFKY